MRPNSDLNNKSNDQSQFFSQKLDSDDNSFVASEKKENPFAAAFKNKMVEKVKDAKNECACAHEESKD